MTPTELDERLNGELQRLLVPAAPPTLLPRVMEAVEKRAHARWFRRSWVTWPAGWQLVSATAVVAVVAGLALALPAAQRAALDPWSVVDAHVPTQATDLLRIGRQVAALMRVSWEVLLQPIATYVAVLVLAVSLGCTALWTALNRLAPGGASRP